MGPDATPTHPSPSTRRTAASPPAPPSTARPRRGVLIAGLAIGAIAVVVLSLLATGVLPGLVAHSGSPGPGAALGSEQVAVSNASQYAAGVGPGPWTLAFVEGVDATVAFSTPASDLLGNASCPLSGGTSTTLTASAWTGNYSVGLSGGWLVALSTPGPPLGLLIVWVTASGVANLGEESGAGCYLASVIHPIPNGLLNSPAAASVAATTPDGAAFVRANPSANAEYELTNQSYASEHGVAVNAPQWIVQFSDCVGGQYDDFSSDLFANNGTVISAAVFDGGSCSSTNALPLGSAFAFGSVSDGTCPSGDTYAANGCAAGDATETVGIAGSSVTFGNVLFAVQSADGENLTITGPGGFSILTDHGAVAAQTVAGSSLAMSASWSIYGAPSVCGAGCGPTTPLTPVDAILIDFGASSPFGASDQLVAYGTDGYIGSVGPLALP